MPVPVRSCYKDSFETYTLKMTAPGALQFDPATAQNAFWTDIGLVVPRITSSVHAHGDIVNVQSTAIPPVIDRMNRHGKASFGVQERRLL